MSAHLRLGPRFLASKYVAVPDPGKAAAAGAWMTLLVLAALVGAASATGSDAAAASHTDTLLTLTPCARDLGVTGAVCGYLPVWEDRDAASGRRIRLRVAVLPALGRETRPDPLFLLAGGPGMAATDLAELAEEALRRIREKRQVVLVDQRGTGQSHPLDCGVDADSTYYLLDEDVPYQVLRDCLAGYDADPRHYTTAVAMDDLDDVRAALGFTQINLWGGSYGTRAALVYLRRHPQRVRSLILDGVAPPSIRLPLHVGQDARRALERMFNDCAADADCAGAFPDLQATFDDLLRRLQTHPQRVSAPHPRTGEPVDVDVTRDGVARLVRAALYSVDATRLLPLAIQRAADGDYRPLMGLAEPLTEVATHVSVGLMFSVLCAEDMAAIGVADTADLAAEPLLGTTVWDVWNRVCGFWPQARVPARYYEPVASDKPVLVLSGDLDPVTPPRWGEAVAAHLPNSLHVVVPGAAHGTIGYGCVQRLMARFLESGSVQGLDTTCVEALGRPPFFRRFTGPRVGAGSASATGAP